MMTDPPELATAATVALRYSEQGFGVVELIRGVDGAPADFRYIMTNPAFDQASGEAWATGRPASSILTEYRAPWLEGFARVVATAAPWRYEMDWGRRIYSAEVLPAGEDRAAILFSDITELRQREREVVDAIDRFESTERAAETGSFRWSLPDRRVQLSRGALAVLAMPERGDSIGLQSGIDLLHPDDRPATPGELIERLAAFDRIGQPWEPRVALPDGSVRWLSIRARLHRDGRGEVSHVDGQFTDVTIRKRGEDRLAKSERRFRVMANCAPIIVWSTGAGGEIEFTSEAWRVFAGFPVPGGDWRSVLHPDDRRAFLVAFARAVSRREQFDRTVRARRGDGAARWLHVIAVSRPDPAGDYLGHVGVAIDETGQRQAVEDSQTALRAAEQANRLKSEFLAVMSHELRTPLNAVIGYADLLLMQASGPLDETQTGDVMAIAAAGRRLLLLVNDVLDLARIEAGEWMLDPEPVALDGAVAETVAELRPQAAARGLTVVTRCPGGLPPAIADRRAIHQILLNLIGNAIKFTEAGTVEVDVRAEPGTVAVSVADTGPGIAPEALPHIFEAFRQADASTTRRHGGGGLGLAIVERLSRLMGGTVEVQSTLRVGSTFTVRLPVNRAVHGAPDG
jgi:PAS domain S-box-containing protein